MQLFWWDIFMDVEAEGKNIKICFFCVDSWNLDLSLLQEAWTTILLYVRMQ